MSDTSSSFGSDPVLPVGEQVYRVVREAIVTLKLLPNAPISENSLAKKLAASRTPIRQALQRLEREGLVVILPQRGSFVAPLDLQAVRSAYVARLALEKAVAGEAARLRTSAGVARLRAGIVAQRELLAGGGSAEAFFELNHRFHADLVVIADLGGLGATIDSVTAQLGRVRAAHLAYADPYPLVPLVDQHEELTNAIAAGDAEQAQALMEAHIQPVLPRLTLLRKERPDFFEPARDPGNSPWSVIEGGLTQ